MKVKSVRKITDCPHLNLFRLTYEDQQNRQRDYFFASRSGHDNPLEAPDSPPDAVVVVPCHADEKKLVIIEEFRVVLGGYQYGFPAGLIEKGESIEQAGKRELFEETGLELTRVLQQSPKVFSSSGMTDESVSLLFVECRGTPTSEHNEASEDIRVKLISEQEARRILLDPHIRFDVKSWMALNTFAARGVVLMFSDCLFFLIALVIYTTADLLEGEALSGLWGWPMLMAAHIGFAGLCRAGFARLKKKAAQRPFALADQAVSRMTTRLSILALLLFAADLYGFKLHLFFKKAPGFERFPTLGALVFILLFLFYLIIIWEASWHLRRALFSERLSKRHYLFSHIVLSLPALLPWLCLSFAADLLGLVPWPPLQTFLKSPFGEAVYVGFFVIFIAVIGPVMIRRLWRCRPLEKGGTRSRIEAVCRETGLSYADILKWDLFGGHMITAGVMGLWGRFRYILTTPALLRSLSYEQMEAVMLHEIGHVQRRHMLFYLLFFMGFMVTGFFWFRPLALLLYALPIYAPLKFVGMEMATAHAVLSCLMLILLFVLYFRFIFGFYMRNCERQADLHVYKYRPDASALITAFYKIAACSGQSMDKPSWHHFSLGERIRFLERCRTAPDLIRRHHVRVRNFIWLYAALILLMAGLGYAVNYGRASQPFYRYIDEKIRLQQTLVYPDSPDVHTLFGDYYQGLEKFQKAIDAYEAALRADPENIMALNNLSMLFSTVKNPYFKDPQQALVLAERALEQGNQAFLWDTCAEALSAGHQNQKAVSAARRALALATDNQAFYSRQVERFKRLAREQDGSDG